MVHPLRNAQNKSLASSDSPVNQNFESKDVGKPDMCRVDLCAMCCWRLKSNYSAASYRWWQSILIKDKIGVAELMDILKNGKETFLLTGCGQ